MLKQLYDALHRDIVLRTVLEANIISLKLKVSISLFRNISPLARYSKEYHCETCLTISLIIFIFEIGNISKYVTNHDTFNPKVSFFIPEAYFVNRIKFYCAKETNGWGKYWGEITVYT
jgi:hypothetical protein